MIHTFDCWLFDASVRRMAAMAFHEAVVYLEARLLRLTPSSTRSWRNNLVGGGGSGSTPDIVRSFCVFALPPLGLQTPKVLLKQQA